MITINEDIGAVYMNNSTIKQIWYQGNLIWELDEETPTPPTPIEGDDTILYLSDGTSVILKPYLDKDTVSGHFNEYWFSFADTNKYRATCTAVTIGNLVEVLGTYNINSAGAFDGFALLTNVVIPNNVTELHFDCFRNCTNLTSVTIPSSVTNIASNVFIGCVSLTDIYFDGTYEKWNTIMQGNYWNYDLPQGSTLHCTDGDIQVK